MRKIDRRLEDAAQKAVAKSRRPAAPLKVTLGEAMLTKQGIRDLGGNNRRPVRKEEKLIPKVVCGHVHVDTESDRCLDCGARRVEQYDYI